MTEMIELAHMRWWGEKGKIFLMKLLEMKNLGAEIKYINIYILDIINSKLGTMVGGRGLKEGKGVDLKTCNRNYRNWSIERKDWEKKVSLTSGII